MNRTLLIIAAIAGAVATLPAVAQQNQDAKAPPEQQETVPLQLKADQVMDMQHRLNQQGFDAGQVDGRWGPNTAAAIKRFQTKHGLQSTGRLDQKTLAALGVIGTIAASPVPHPQTTSPVETPVAVGATTRPTEPADAAGNVVPANPPSAAVGPATASTPGTSGTGSNPAGVKTGTDAASGNSNQAVATTNADAPQPAHGANSFTMGEARGRIANHGFQSVSELHEDDTGVWRGTATKNGQQAQVWLDYKGNVGQQ